MNWDAIDFVVFGVLLLSVAVIYALAARKTGNTAYRAAVGIAIGTAFILVWVNGAVGIIGNESNDANEMYFGVLAVGIIGVVIARFKSLGMARALYATALAQVFVAVIALLGDLGSAGPIWPWDVLALTGFFAVLWLISGWLFRKAARQQLIESAEEKNEGIEPII